MEAPGYELREVAYLVDGKEFYREEETAYQDKPYSGIIEYVNLPEHIRLELQDFLTPKLHHPDRPCFVLMAGRHEVPVQDGMPLVVGAWFLEWDFANRMGKGGLSGTGVQGPYSMSDLEGKDIDIVVTGLGPALIECIIEAQAWGVGTINFWHWDREANSYYQQVLELNYNLRTR